MSLTKLSNYITSRTGRELYVSPDDFNATDSLDNRGNTPLEPFKTIQRAFLEVARYSYRPGFNNDRFSEFTIKLSPGVYYIDNRPSTNNLLDVESFVFNENEKKFDSRIDDLLDIRNENNIYRHFNTTEGGCIIPRGCALVGLDLRHTIIKPLYVPDPVSTSVERTAIFNTTGECYFYGFTIRDGEVSSDSPLYNIETETGEVYFKQVGDRWEKESPLYSHHKITCFVFAPKNELDLFYRKVAKAFSQFQPTIDDPGEFNDRIEETRIVGPLSDRRSIRSLELRKSEGLDSSTDVVVELNSNHPYFTGQLVAISDTGIDDLLEGVFPVVDISFINKREFTYRVPVAATALGEGYVINPITPTIINADSVPALSPSATSAAEIDTTESASPYVYNVTLRSDWGQCGMWADGLKTSGFKSMVVAQFTGISLQKDDRAFIRYDDNTNTWNSASLQSAFSPTVEHTKGDAYWKTDWRTFHIRASHGAFIQVVSVFAIGQASHFLMESGGDMSITNSNSNFGDTSLVATGFNGIAYSKDKSGYISDIIPPQVIDTSLSNEEIVKYYVIDIPKTIAEPNNETKIYIGNEETSDLYTRPVATVNGNRIGTRSNEKLYVKLDPDRVGGNEVFDADVSPSGFTKYIAKPYNVVPEGITSVGVDRILDSAASIELNKTLIQEEAFGYMLDKYPTLRSSEKVFPDRSDFVSSSARDKLFDGVSSIIKNKRFIQDEALKRTIEEFSDNLPSTIRFVSRQERRESKCFRDIGFFIDSLIEDLRRGGNRAVRAFVDLFKSGEEIIHVSDELSETKFAYSYAGRIAIASIRNFSWSLGTAEIEDNYILVVSDNSGILVGMRVVNVTHNNQPVYVQELVGSNKIILKLSDGTTVVNDLVISSNPVFIIDQEFFNEISVIRDSVTVDESLPPCSSVAERIFNLTVDTISLLSGEEVEKADAEDLATTSLCYRDIGFFIDALVGDLKTGGNARSIKVGESYRTGDSVQFIDGELEETVATYEYAANLAIAAMRNFRTILTGVDITAGSSEVNVGDNTGIVIGMKVEQIRTSNKSIPDGTYVAGIPSDSSTNIILGTRGSTSTFDVVGTLVEATSDNSSATLEFTSPTTLIWSQENISTDPSIAVDTENPSCRDIASRINGLTEDTISAIRGNEVERQDTSLVFGQSNTQSGRGKLLDAANLIERNREAIAQESLERIKYSNNNISLGNLQLVADNHENHGIAIYDNYAYVVSSTKVFVYELRGSDDAIRATTKDFDLASDNGSPRGIAAHNGYIYVVDTVDQLIYSYRLTSSGAEYTQSRNISLSNLDNNLGIQGLSVYNNHIYLVSRNLRRVYAYNLTSGYDSTKTFDLVINNNEARGIAIDRGYVYVLNNSGSGTAEIFVYKLNDDSVTYTGTKNLFVDGGITDLSFSGIAIYNKQAYITRVSSTSTTIYVIITSILKFSDELCKRDISFFIDALIADLRVGGNLNIIRMGEKYKQGNSTIHVVKEVEETKEAFEYATSLSIAAMRNFRYSVRVVSVTISNEHSYVEFAPGTTVIDGMTISGGQFGNQNLYSVRREQGGSSGRFELWTGGVGNVEFTRVTGFSISQEFTAILTTGETLLRSPTPLVTDETIIRDELETALCSDVEQRLYNLNRDIVRIIDSTSLDDRPEREEPEVRLASRDVRATMFDIDVTGTSSSSAHNFQTGTPVRLSPRPKFSISQARYADVNPEVVRLPKGFETNRTYYVISPGRITSPYNYSEGSDKPLSPGEPTKNKLMLASTKESALAGLYLYSPEADTVDPDVEIDIYQFLSDQSYDLEIFRCVSINGSIIRTATNHNFDSPLTEENAVKVFFSPIPGTDGDLPIVSGSVELRQRIAIQNRLRSDVEFYARIIDNNSFTIHLSLTDARDNINPIVLSYQGQEFNVVHSKRVSPLKYDPTASKWFINIGGVNNITPRLRQRDYSSRLKTTETWISRINDSREPKDRIYRLRYVIPSYATNISPPSNGFVLKTRTDETRGLPSQKIIVRGRPILRDSFSNDLMITKDEFERFGLSEVSIYDPYVQSVFGDTRIRIKTSSSMIATVQSARYYTRGNRQYTELLVFDLEVDDSENEQLKNSAFSVLEISQPENGSGRFLTGREEVAWGDGAGTALVQNYIKHAGKYYLVLKDVVGDLEDHIGSTITQGLVTATIESEPDFGKSISIEQKLEKRLEEFYYAKKSSPVYTLVPGDTFNDSSGTNYTIDSVEKAEEIDNTYYIYDSEVIQEHITNQQDGIYYLSILKGDISPNLTNAGIGNNFKDWKFSQPVGSLYPLINKNDPTWFNYAYTSLPERSYVSGLRDPLPTNSVADNFLHGLVTVNDQKLSATKEAIIDLLKNSPFNENSYTLEAQEGNSSVGSENRKIPISGDDSFVSRSRYYIELRRYSIARAGSHTFEYIGYGPGNYSTGLPIRQQQVKTSLQNFYAHAKRQNGGVVFYTGSDSTGGFYIGNRRYDSITNEVEILESVDISSIVLEDDILSSNLTETFTTSVTFNENIIVLGGTGIVPSTFESPILLSVQGNDLTELEYPLIIRSNIPIDEDPSLDRVNFRPIEDGDIKIGKNLVKSATFSISGRRFGQTYSIRTHVIGNTATNTTPNTTTRTVDFNPRSGDIVLKGKNVEESGSLGWIYSNQPNPPLDLQDISSIEFVAPSTVRINWNGLRTNSIQGITENSELTFEGFNEEYAFLNGVWTIDNSEFLLPNQFVLLRGAEVPPGVPTLTSLVSVSITVANVKWKEFSIIGSEAIRADSDNFGSFKVGINTLSRSSTTDYTNAYVNTRTQPKVTLDVVGNTVITGEVIDYESNDELDNRTITKANDALLVGYSSGSVLNGNFIRPSGLRVSSKDNNDWKVGINTNYDIVDSSYSLIVNGNVDVKGDYTRFPNNPHLGVDSGNDSTVISLFDKVLSNDVSEEDFTGTTDISLSARSVSIAAGLSATPNRITIGRFSFGSEDQSEVRVNTASLTLAGNLRGGTRSATTPFIVSTESSKVSLFDTSPSEVTLARSAALVNIASPIGTTRINNRLELGSAFDIKGSITLIGGTDSSQYVTSRAQFGTEIVYHPEGRLDNLNVDLVVLIREIPVESTLPTPTTSPYAILEIDTPGSGDWEPNNPSLGYIADLSNRQFILPIAPNRLLWPRGTTQATSFFSIISEQVRVGDYLLLEDYDANGDIAASEVIKVIGVTDLQSVDGSRIVVERNPFNISGIILPSRYSDERTKITKVQVINNASYLATDVSPVANPVDVRLSQVSSAVTVGDYILLSGTEFVRITDLSTLIGRVLSVTDGSNSIFEINSARKTIEIDVDDLDIESDNITFTSNTLILATGDEDLFSINGETETVNINSEYFNVNTENIDFNIGKSIFNVRSAIEDDPNTPENELLGSLVSINSDNVDITTNDLTLTSNGLTIRNGIGNSLVVLNPLIQSLEISNINNFDITLGNTSGPTRSLRINASSVDIISDSNITFNKFRSSLISGTEYTLSVDRETINSKGTWQHDNVFSPEVLVVGELGSDRIPTEHRFRVNIENKNFVIKEDSTIDAFGIEGYWNRNGGRKHYELTVDTVFDLAIDTASDFENPLPSVNTVYFFDPSRLVPVSPKRFILPGNAMNGDFIEFIVTGNLSNIARVILKGFVGTVNNTNINHTVMGDSDGLMLNTPYASIKMYYFRNNWYLGASL